MGTDGRTRRKSSPSAAWRLATAEKRRRGKETIKRELQCSSTVRSTCCSSSVAFRSHTTKSGACPLTVVAGGWTTARISLLASICQESRITTIPPSTPKNKTLQCRKALSEAEAARVMAGERESGRANFLPVLPSSSHRVRVDASSARSAWMRRTCCVAWWRWRRLCACDCWLGWLDADVDGRGSVTTRRTWAWR